jgi:hypothetical protein
VDKVADSRALLAGRASPTKTASIRSAKEQRREKWLRELAAPGIPDAKPGRRLGRRIELVTTGALSPCIGPRVLAEAQDVTRGAEEGAGDGRARRRGIPP